MASTWLGSILDPCAITAASICRRTRRCGLSDRSPGLTQEARHHYCSMGLQASGKAISCLMASMRGAFSD